MAVDFQMVLIEATSYLLSMTRDLLSRSLRPSIEIILLFKPPGKHDMTNSTNF